MRDQWIHDRFEKFKSKVAAEQQRQEWDSKARASYDVKFDSLRARIESDIKEYNNLFSRIKDVGAIFHPTVNGGFGVTCSASGMSVQVQKAHAPVIDIHWGSDFQMPPIRSDKLEIIADEHGNIRYRHGEKVLEDLGEASLIILDPVLVA
jgi:hypothetical protein